MNDILDKKRQLFDRWAETYEKDVQNPAGILEGYKESLSIAADAVHSDNHSKVLDIGIGTGGFAELVQDKVDEVYGIDLSPKMLEECAALHPDFKLQEGIFTEIDFPEQHFNDVISSFCFHEVDIVERRKACDEVYRVLKPGGRFVLLDVMFASMTALGQAKQTNINHWDHTEDYSLVAEADGLLYQSGFSRVNWVQTAPCHWVAVAVK